MRRFLRTVAIAVTSLTAVVSSYAVQASDYPSRPITIVVPYGPGGASDLSARLVAGSAPAYLNQPVLAVNKTGAAGVVGSNFVKNAKADGYTLLSARVGSQMGVPAMNKTIPYKWDDFTILGLIEVNPFVLVVSPQSGLKSFADFERKIKNGEEMSYSSAGVGTLLHTGVAVMADAMKADFEKLIHVPFKGGGKAAAAVVSGQVDFSFQNLSAVSGKIEAGQLIPLVVTTPERQKIIENVPTAREVGYQNIEMVIGWSAIYGPPGLPDAVVTKWTDTLQKLKGDRGWNKMTKSLGNIVDIRSPADTKAYVEAQYKAYDKALKKMGLRIE
ncbi:tripartite tricarboxylate transporter substrate binding protein [Alphaproteobacteria bacterium]|jgi:tripartite-type tricarboxylate transporter receptor subunit TctC|nr:tripartite tricarboxylate transporter substrate binding protein [Alphaproteobacteria bacterium]